MKEAAMQRLMGVIVGMIGLFFAAGLVIAREWEAPPANAGQPLQIVFTSRFPDGTATALVRIIGVDGSNLRILNASLSYVCSLNGKYFAYLSDGIWQILNSDGSNPRSVRLNVDPYRLIGLVLTNDGRLLAFNQFGGTNQEITVAEPGKDNQRFQISLPALARTFALSADGERIVFAADDFSRTIYITNLAGSQPVRVLNGSSVYADWSPDDSAVYSLSAELFLYLTDARTLQSVRVTSASEYGAVWSPDGDQLAFVRDGDIYTVALRDFSERRLTYDGSSANAWPCFLGALPASLITGGS
jgi:WD40 repeat protein